MSHVQPSSELPRKRYGPVDRIKDHVWKIGSGITPSGGAASYLDAGIPLLRSQNVHFDGLRLDDVAYIAEETHDEMSGTKLRAHDVLLEHHGSFHRSLHVRARWLWRRKRQPACMYHPSSGEVEL